MRFRWNSYWHNWSRILGTGPRGGQCEVCCTPVNGWRIEEQVERVRAVNVREHFTRPDPRDKIVDSLPPDVVAEMLSGGLSSLSMDLAKREGVSDPAARGAPLADFEPATGNPLAPLAAELGRMLA